jgi:hypothetical protein
MFDTIDDAGLVDQMAAAACEENAACARRLAWLGELWARRAPEDEDERAQWTVDGLEAVAAEVSAALRVSRRRAAAQVEYAIGLRLLPEVAEVFRRGEIDFRVVAILLSRISNIADAKLLAKLDAAMAKWVSRWTRLSRPKLIARIDAWVAKFDPAAVRLPRERVEDRSVVFMTLQAGLISMWGSLTPEDAVVVDDRLDEFARSVCAGDPRTHAQRRADSLAAIASGLDRLPCRCGAEDCPGSSEKPLVQTVIHVLAEQSTLDGGDALGFMAGHGPLPAQSVREMVKKAKLKPLVIPKNARESGYRPSTALAEYVRWRDMTCRFPGCEHPAEFCDIDHTVPYPLGPTHPSNLKCLCRKHHLLKTFYTGALKWAEKQLPDGTVVWTAPTGHTYTTLPGGSVFFPVFAQPTGRLAIPKQSEPPSPTRGVMMPRRRRTRAEDKQARRDYERRINEERIAEEQRQHQAWLKANDEPPPF